ncbi:MAG: hypothetical protein GY754_10570 [bacterium]|nr:hypothetical protein [bacterium]
MKHGKQLSLFQASAVITGLGVGGGIMAVPYLASLNGIIPMISIMICAYAVSILLHLMITEMVMLDGQNSQFVELLSRYLFHGRGKTIFTWTFFIIIVINFYALLAGYIAGAAEIIVNLSGIPEWSAKVLMYIFAAGPVFFGLKALGISEEYAIAGIGVLLIVMTVGSFNHSFNTIPLWAGGAKKALALYGMVIFSLSSIFAIPEAVEGLSWNKKLIPWSIILGKTINLLFILIITIMTILSSSVDEKVAIISWGKSIGNWAVLLSSVFTLLAILTSYWAVTYALAIVIEERLNWEYRLSWFVATLPTLLISLSGITFMGFMKIAGGALAILVTILVVPAFRAVKKQKKIEEKVLTLPFLEKSIFQIIIILAFLVAAIGMVFK